MADVNVTSTADVDSVGRLAANNNAVFVDPSTGYVFYKEASGGLRYKKTTDRGETWGSSVTVMTPAGTPFAWAIWPDQRTPGDSGTKVHCAMLDITNGNDHRYRALDLSDDSLGPEVSFHTNTGATSSTFAYVSITKTRGGNINILGRDGSGSGTRFHARSTNAGASFSARTVTGPGGAQAPFAMAFPGNEADEDDIYYIYNHKVVGDIDLHTYDDSADTWSDEEISGDANIDFSISEMSAAVQHSDNHVFLVFINETGNDLELWEITNGTTFEKIADIVTDDSTIYFSTISIDQASNVKWIAYIDSDGDNIVYRTYNGTVGSEAPVSETLDYPELSWLFSVGSIPATGGLFIVGWGEESGDDVWVNVVFSSKTQTQALPQVFAVD
ncbi:hypothetical protein LCGC14_0391330 [marine sediment metagenome]|uniref:Uncharacterized protein n=1 Tax=marine sediment metagenome TaxID=412755 RepID=A0A0F9THG6_9ZZZZ